MVTILTFTALLALSALFSGTEIAFFSLTPGKVRTMVRQKLFAAKLVEQLKQNPRRLLITVLIGNNLVNISGAAIATELALSLFGHEGVAIATGVVTFLVLMFGEIFPKSFAQLNPERISRYTAHFIYALSIILSPIAWCLEKIMDALAIQQSTNASAKIAEDEIHSLFQIGHEKGFIEEHEKEFAERLFKFNDAPVSSVMKSPECAFMLDGNALVRDVVNDAASSGYSRFPVYDGGRKNIVGVVHVKDILKEVGSPLENQRVSSITNAPFFIHDTDNLDDAFRAMRAQHSHYALVHNNAKEVVGLITFEDVLEELIGEIYDESDKRKKGLIT